MDLAIVKASDSISDWTWSIGRSETSRQVEERPTSVRVRVLEVEAEEDLRVFRVWRMTESGFSLDLKGRLSESASELGGGRRRLFLSAIGGDRKSVV